MTAPQGQHSSVAPTHRVVVVHRVGAVVIAVVIAAFGVLASGVFDHALDRRLSESGIPALAAKIPPAERRKLGAAQAPPGATGRESREVRQAIEAALTDSFQVAMRIAAGLALLSSVCALTLIRSRRPARR